MTHTVEHGRTPLTKVTDVEAARARRVQARRTVLEASILPTPQGSGQGSLGGSTESLGGGEGSSIDFGQSVGFSGNQSAGTVGDQNNTLANAAQAVRNDPLSTTGLVGMATGLLGLNPGVGLAAQLGTLAFGYGYERLSDAYFGFSHRNADTSVDSLENSIGAGFEMSGGIRGDFGPDTDVEFAASFVGDTSVDAEESSGGEGMSDAEFAGSFEGDSSADSEQNNEGGGDNGASEGGQGGVGEGGGIGL